LPAPGDALVYSSKGRWLAIRATDDKETVLKVERHRRLAKENGPFSQ